MYDVQILENVYRRATQAARAQNVTVEEFVLETLRRRLGDEVLWLSEDQMAKVRIGQEDVRAGRVLSLEEAASDLKLHRKAWLAEHPD